MFWNSTYLQRDFYTFEHSEASESWSSSSLGVQNSQYTILKLITSKRLSSASKGQERERFHSRCNFEEISLHYIIFVEFYYSSFILRIKGSGTKSVRMTFIQIIFLLRFCFVNTIKM